MATATHYDPTMPVLEARARYFADNDFGPDGGYGQRWVVLAKIGPLPLAFPNTAARVRAVGRHDLHHIVTDYDTDLLGEAEIAAWELAGGCGNFRAAWVLNTLILPLGVLRDRERIERAFARGSRTRNLYAEPDIDSLLDRPLGELRRRLAAEHAEGGEDSGTELTPAQRRRYRRFVAAGVVANVCLLLLGLGVLAVVVLALLWALGL